MSAPEIVPILPDTPNFRDAGGWPGLRGARVRQGAFYRSPALSALSRADAERLEALDPVAIVDFRGREEAEMNPSTLPDALRTRRLHAPVEPRAGARLREALAAGALTDAIARDAMIESYRNYVEQNADAFADFLRTAAGAVADGRAVIFHCTAGKDRTGFAAALLLGALGVTREHVYEDYLRTNALWVPPAALASQLPAVAHGVLFRVDAVYLDSALAALDASHGGAEGFAREALGGEAGLARLREAALG